MSKRLFLAADISDEARREASKHSSDLKAAFPDARVNWTRPENLHITIKFLGDTEEDAISGLETTVANVTDRVQPFVFYLGSPEILGNRVVSIRVLDESSTVFSLEMMLDTECQRLGYEREGRRFHPHLTLGRIRDPKGTGQLRSHHLQTPINPIRFEIREIVLYESELGPGGSVYRPLRRFKLELRNK